MEHGVGLHRSSYLIWTELDWTPTVDPAQFSSVSAIWTLLIMF